MGLRERGCRPGVQRRVCCNAMVAGGNLVRRIPSFSADVGLVLKAPTAERAEDDCLVEKPEARLDIRHADRYEEHSFLRNVKE
jgi:hypothetical protein